MKHTKLDGLLLFSLFIISVISFFIIGLSDIALLNHKIAIGIILTICSTIGFVVVLAKRLPIKQNDDVKRYKSKYLLIAILLLTLSIGCYMVEFVSDKSIFIAIAIVLNMGLIGLILLNKKL